MKPVETEKAPKASIVTGAELDPKTFADFHQRLFAAQNPATHGTSDPIYCVYTKKPIYGVHPDFHSKAVPVVIMDGGESCILLEQYYSHLDDDDVDDQSHKKYLDETDYLPFNQLSVDEKMELINRSRRENTATYCVSVNEWVSAHFTPEAAQAFIARKQHDYPYGLEVVVESSYHCYEFNAIRYAFLNSNLHYLPDDLACNITPTAILEPNLEHSIYDATVDDIGSVINSVMAYYKVSFADLALTTNMHRTTIHYIAKGTRKVTEKQLTELKKALLYAISACERKPIEFETCKDILIELQTLRAEKQIAKLNAELEESLSVSVQKPDAYTVKSRKLAFYCFAMAALVSVIQLILYFLE